MGSSNTPKITDVEGFLAAFKLSADHIYQLLSLSDVEGASPSKGSLERAFAAHRDIADRLANAVRDRPTPVLSEERVFETVEPSATRPHPTISTQVSSSHVKLGPLPRFVPVQNSDYEPIE